MGRKCETARRDWCDDLRVWRKGEESEWGKRGFTRTMRRELDDLWDVLDELEEDEAQFRAAG